MTRNPPTVVAILLWLGFVDGAPAGTGAPDPIGYWMNEKGTVVINIEDCENDELCGHIVWLKNPRRTDSGAIKLDEENPNESLRDRPLCGLEVMRGFQQNEDERSRWLRGEVYNPEEGKSYKSKLEVKSAEKLLVRGYILVSLLGKNMIWTRLSQPPGGCESPREPGDRAPGESS